MKTFTRFDTLFENFDNLEEAPLQRAASSLRQHKWVIWSEMKYGEHNT